MLSLKQLSIDDGKEIYKMLQEIGDGENGFSNKANGLNYIEFQCWLKKEYERDCGNIENWMVPQTSYWLYDDNTPVGYGRIRHFLNDNLKQNSGNIGYAIRKTERGKGYGNEILRLLLIECKKIRLYQVQISTRKDNLLSNKVIIKNGGSLIRSNDKKNFYIVNLLDFRKLEINEFDALQNLWDFDKCKFAKQFKSEFKAENRAIYVAALGDNLTAECDFVFNMNESGYTIPDKRIYLSRLIVKKERRNEGVGKAMLRFMVNTAKEMGYDELSVGVDADNLPALHIYEKFGFQTFETAYDEYGKYFKMMLEL